MAAGKRSRTAKDLRKQIQLILSQVKPDSKIYPEVGMGLSEFLRAKEAREAGHALPPEDAVAREKKSSTVANEQVRLLKILCGQPGHGADEFVKILADEVDEVNAAVIIHTLIELGRLKAVLGVIGSRKKNETDIRRVLWGAIREKLRREPHRFSDADLDAMRTKEIPRRIPKPVREDDPPY
jgi:hypothetical protein